MIRQKIIFSTIFFCFQFVPDMIKYRNERMAQETEKRERTV